MVKRGPNARALGRTLTELRSLHRLEKVDEARIEALRSMARALDERPTNANLWKIYHVALERLISSGPGDSDIDKLLAELSSDVGDTPPHRT